MSPSRAKLELNMSPEEKAEIEDTARRLQQSQTWVMLRSYRIARAALLTLEPPLIASGS